MNPPYMAPPHPPPHHHPHPPLPAAKWVSFQPGGPALPVPLPIHAIPIHHHAGCFPPAAATIVHQPHGFMPPPPSLPPPPPPEAVVSAAAPGVMVPLPLPLTLTLAPAPFHHRQQQHQQPPLSLLALGPITSADDVVNLLVDAGDGREYAFAVHRRLLCHFSAHVRELFAAAEREAEAEAEREEEKEKEKQMRAWMLKVKGFNYLNELDFDDDDDDGHFQDQQQKLQKAGGSSPHRSEADDVEVQVIVRLPPSTSTPSPPTAPCPAPPASAPSNHPLPPPKLRLGAVKPHVVAALLEWLYRAPSPAGSASASAATLIELWVLAGRLRIPACQNDCAAAIERCRRRDNVIQTGMLGWVYANTNPNPNPNISPGTNTIAGEGKWGEWGEGGGCALRNLLVDQCAWLLDVRWLLGGTAGAEEMDGEGDGAAANEAMLPREFLVDLVARLRVLLAEGHGPGEMGELGRMEMREGRRYWLPEEEEEEQTEEDEGEDGGEGEGETGECVGEAERR